MNNKLFSFCLMLYSGIHLSAMETDSRHQSYKEKRIFTTEEQPIINIIFDFDAVFVPSTDPDDTKELMVVMPKSTCKLMKYVATLIKKRKPAPEIERQIDVMYDLLIEGKITFCDLDQNKVIVHQYPQLAMKLQHKYEEKYSRDKKLFAYLKQQLSNVHNQNQF